MIGGSVDEITDVQLIIQFALSIIMIMPALYWFKMREEIFEGSPEKNSEKNDLKIHIILPMRNEITNVERKISSIISEILPYKSVFLTVADSSSSDGTISVAESLLRSSDLEDYRWGIENFEMRGKNIALNGVIEKNEADIFVMSDADANVSPGWLRIILSRLSEKDIGVVSGIEAENSYGSDFNSYYRRKSNWLRIMESRLDSTPILEGSILAWKAESVGSFRFDERVNADDAQIGLHSIKCGHRSIVDPRIIFEDFGSEKRTFRESIRRAQGLSIALMSNLDLAIMKGRGFARSAIFNAVVLYIFFPWSALFFVINALIAFLNDPIIDHSWEFYSITSVLIVSMMPQGRSLIIGSTISIIAHLQAIIGRKYSKWEPYR